MTNEELIVTAREVLEKYTENNDVNGVELFCEYIDKSPELMLLLIDRLCLAMNAINMSDEVERLREIVRPETNGRFCSQFYPRCRFYHHQEGFSDYCSRYQCELDESDFRTIRCDECMKEYPNTLIDPVKE